MAFLLLAPAMCQLSHVEDRYSRYRLETTEVKMFFLPLQSIREQSIFQGYEEVIGCILPGSHVPTQSRPLQAIDVHPSRLGAISIVSPSPSH
jgi:O-phosphoseryl-tRNA(Cys) synthetase